MTYATLRGPGDRPLTRDMTGADEVSPCRGCEHVGEIKNEFPACLNCQKLAKFQGRDRPVNFDIDRKPEKAAKYDTPDIKTLPKAKKWKKIPDGTKCSICKTRPATSGCFKNLYNDVICNTCYRRLMERLRTTGTIYVAGHGKSLGSVYKKC